VERPGLAVLAGLPLVGDAGVGLAVPPVADQRLVLVAVDAGALQQDRRERVERVDVVEHRDLDRLRVVSGVGRRGDGGAREAEECGCRDTRE
jgi:hypothetical protein